MPGMRPPTASHCARPAASRRHGREGRGPRPSRELSIGCSAEKQTGASRIGAGDGDGKRADPNGSRSTFAVSGQIVRSNSRADGPDLGGPVWLNHGADLHLDARRRDRRSHPGSDHAVRRARLQLGVGNHRCRRVSDGSLQPTGAQRRAVAGDAHGRQQRRGASHDRGRDAAAPGVRSCRRTSWN